MTGRQYRAAIAKLGLTQERSGIFFGYSPRQGQRFASGEKKIPAAVRHLIKLMLQTSTTPGQLDPKFQTAKTFA